MNKKPNIHNSIKKNGKSFHWASRMLGDKEKQNAQKAYEFFRYIDDICDESGNAEWSLMRLNQIKEELNINFSQDPTVRLILELKKQLQIGPTLIKQFIEGIEWDIHHNQIANQAQLLRYGYGVASTVGILMCYVLNVEERSAFRFAIDLGIAMQLTNIARDVLEDARMGRIYLPQTWFGVPISPSDILYNEKLRPDVFYAINRCLTLAENYYDSANDGMRYLAPRARVSIMIALRVYKKIGQKIQSMNSSQYWKISRVYTTKWEKIGASVGALFDYLSKRCYSPSSPPLPHQSSLHEEIEDLVCHAL